MRAPGVEYRQRLLAVKLDAPLHRRVFRLHTADGEVMECDAHANVKDITSLKKMRPHLTGRTPGFAVEHRRVMKMRVHLRQIEPKGKTQDAPAPCISAPHQCRDSHTSTRKRARSQDPQTRLERQVEINGNAEAYAMTGACSLAQRSRLLNKKCGRGCGTGSRGQSEAVRLTCFHI